MESRWIWPFELTEKLGEGGMGAVYRARYAGNNRQVAVKLLPDEVAADSVLAARFERELDVLKQLRHPHIVRCFGGKCESDQQFYAMELVDGGTLADVILENPIAWEKVVDYGVQMCEALQYAHEHGIVHRDIKPGNFLLTKSGQIKLSDFGLASIASNRRLTAAGKTVGTIQYMAPEQIRGKPAITNRADLYALGCVLFEMLTGQPPYTGDNVAAILQSHLKAPIPHAAAIVLDCPLKLDQLIVELLSKDPEQRPASAMEVGWRLEEILQPGRHATPVEPQLFASTTARTMVVKPLKNIAATPSDADLTTVLEPRVSSAGWWVAVGLLVSINIAFWMGWSRSETRVSQVEQTLTTMLLQPDLDKRQVAVQTLVDLGKLHGPAIDKVRDATRDKDAGARSAALTVMSRHAPEFRSLLTEVQRIEKVDDDAHVRFQASQTVQALKEVPPDYSLTRMIIWGVVLATAAGIAGAACYIWLRVKPYAT